MGTNGQEAQDRAAEVLFRGYFSEGRAPNDQGTLREAARAAGLDPGIVDDRRFASAELEAELQEGRRMVTSGVQAAAHATSPCRGAPSIVKDSAICCVLCLPGATEPLRSPDERGSFPDKAIVWVACRVSSMSSSHLKFGCSSNSNTR